MTAPRPKQPVCRCALWPFPHKRAWECANLESEQEYRPGDNQDDMSVHHEKTDHLSDEDYSRYMGATK